MVRSVCILSCCEEKRPAATWAENLYISESFLLSRRYAETHFDKWFVLSAKYGLLKPGDLAEPYDRQISELSHVERQALVASIADGKSKIGPNEGAEFTSFCASEYNRVLEMAKIHAESSPIAKMSRPEKHAELKKFTDPNGTEVDLENVYSILQRIIDARGLIPFREAVRQEMPMAGLYLFFDTHEPRLRDIRQLRVVRVGTHGVASGSKASLRDRMRTHYGTAKGGGNHRSSVFRLHVGRALIEKGLVEPVKSWGTSELPQNQKWLKMEGALEGHVSEYIGNLSVVLLGVPGDSAKDNDRAYLEQNLIALLSNAFHPLDPPSHQWLGRYSDKAEIRKSGLWNVNHTSQTYHQQFANMLEYYVRLTLGERTGNKPVAPSDWLASVRDDVRQLRLFSEP
ncbi:MAG: hypothetical protein H6924_08275 [Alphaproteobacteria bacterium]|nr:hypothetical protein [Alphaproteobacteria bacterium]